MEKLIEKVDNLKEILENQECIKKIKELNKKILLDEELLSLIKKYHNTKDTKIKKMIYNNELIKEYKQNETDINIIIMEINSKLKEINKGKCRHENN